MCQLEALRLFGLGPTPIRHMSRLLIIAIRIIGNAGGIEQDERNGGERRFYTAISELEVIQTDYHDGRQHIGQNLAGCKIRPNLINIRNRGPAGPRFLFRHELDYSAHAVYNDSSHRVVPVIGQ